MLCVLFGVMGVSRSLAIDLINQAAAMDQTEELSTKVPVELKENRASKRAKKFKRGSVFHGGSNGRPYF
jgi:hypothetical protein